MVWHQKNLDDDSMQVDRICEPGLLANGWHMCTLTSLVVKFLPTTVIPSKAGWVL
jgi:hypothetical protein